METPVELRWSHFATIVGICTVAGWAVAVPMVILTEFSDVPSMDLLVLVPLVAAQGICVAAVLAIPASVLGSIPLILMKRHWGAAPLASWLLAGGAVGSLIGVLPVAYVVVALAANGEGVKSAEVFRPVMLSLAPGAFSGSLVAWWYRATVLGRQPAEQGVAP